MIKVHSYNALRAEVFGKDLNWVDRMILMRSSPHTHTEVEFSNGKSFSATMRKPYECARFLDIDYNLQRWDTVKIPCTIDEEQVMYAKAVELEDTPYDLIGLLSTISKHDIIRPSDKAVWCTEAVMKVIRTKEDIDWFFTVNNMSDEQVPSLLDWMLRYYVG